MNEEFEKTAKAMWPTIPLHKRPSGEYMVDALNDCLHFWQASRKQALEEAAKACDVLAWEADENMKLEDDERFGVYAKKYRKAADAIRALQKE